MERLTKRAYSCIKVVVLFLCSMVSFAQEQWKQDQEAGKFWYVDEGYLYTHDPEENRPGTLMVIPKKDGTEIRIYSDLSFTKNGETRVRYASGEAIEEAESQFELWPTVLVEGRQGYINVPEDLASEFLKEGKFFGSITLQIVDRFDETATRTFTFDGYEEAFEQLRITQPALAIPDNDGLYLVTFDVFPSNASVVVYRKGFFGGQRSEPMQGPSFTLDMSDGEFWYISKMRGYVEQEEKFRVPDIVEVNINLEQPSGSLKSAVDDGYMAPEIYGDGWPLTTDEVYLGCEQQHMATASIGSEGTYALNRAAEDLYPSIEPFVEEARNDNYDLVKMDITPLVEMALGRCE